MVLLLSSCTFYDINVDVLAPEKNDGADVFVIINIHDNNDADTTRTDGKISAIPE